MSCPSPSTLGMCSMTRFGLQGLLLSAARCDAGSRACPSAWHCTRCRREDDPYSYTVHIYLSAQHTGTLTTLAGWPAGNDLRLALAEMLPCRTRGKWYWGPRSKRLCLRVYHMQDRLVSAQAEMLEDVFGRVMSAAEDQELRPSATWHLVSQLGGTSMELAWWSKSS